MQTRQSARRRQQRAATAEPILESSPIASKLLEAETAPWSLLDDGDLMNSPPLVSWPPNTSSVPPKPRAEVEPVAKTGKTTTKTTIGDFQLMSPFRQGLASFQLTRTPGTALRTESTEQQQRPSVSIPQRTNRRRLFHDITAQVLNHVHETDETEEGSHAGKEKSLLDLNHHAEDEEQRHFFTESNHENHTEHSVSKVSFYRDEFMDETSSQAVEEHDELEDEDQHEHSYLTEYTDQPANASKDIQVPPEIRRVAIISIVVGVVAMLIAYYFKLGMFSPASVPLAPNITQTNNVVENDTQLSASLQRVHSILDRLSSLEHVMTVTKPDSLPLQTSFAPSVVIPQATATSHVEPREPSSVTMTATTTEVHRIQSTLVETVVVTPTPPPMPVQEYDPALAGRQALMHPDTKHLLKQIVHEMVDEQLDKYGVDRVNMADYALEAGGARVIPQLTSATFDPFLPDQSHAAFLTWTSWIVDPFLNIFGLEVTKPQFQFNSRSHAHLVSRSLAGRRQFHTPSVVLQSTTTLGRCWPMASQRGFFTVQLSRPILPTHFTIDHLPRSHALGGDVRSAPREVEVWSIAMPVNNTWSEHARLLSRYSYRIDVDETTDGNQTESDDAGLVSSIQTFSVDPHVRIKEPVQAVQLRVLSNHGNDRYTCLYRFRVHGTTV